MERVLFVVAMLFVAGCGGNGVPAPLACPATRGEFAVSLYTSFGSDVTEEARFLYFTSAKPEYPNARALELRTESDIPPPRMVFGDMSFSGPRERIVSVSGEAYDGAEIPGPEQLVEFNRNCDLLAEIGLTPEGDELTMDLRWIERVE